MKEELSIYNLPENVLFQFSSADYYVWKVKRYATLDGNYESNEASVFTEVYRKDGDDTVRCQWSGSLIENPSVFGKNGMYGENTFGIFSYDMDTSKAFTMDMPLKEVNPEIAKQVSLPEQRRTR